MTTFSPRQVWDGLATWRADALHLLGLTGSQLPVPQALEESLGTEPSFGDGPAYCQPPLLCVCVMLLGG